MRINAMTKCVGIFYKFILSNNINVYYPGNFVVFYIFILKTYLNQSVYNNLNYLVTILIKLKSQIHKKY